MTLPADQQIRLLESQLRVANAELARLRRRLGEKGAHSKRLDRAYSDALLLAELHLAFLPTSRAFARERVAMTHNHWENAMALLRLARCYNRRHWVEHDLATIEERLAKAKQTALETPDAYRARLPKHVRPGDD